MEIQRLHASGGNRKNNLLEDVTIHLALCCDPELHKTHNDRPDSSNGGIHKGTPKSQGTDQERHEERERHQGPRSIYRFRDEQFVKERGPDLCADLIVDDVPIDEVDLMQYPKIEAAVYLNKLGVWSFKFRIIERANDETRNVHELRLDIQDLRTVLQLGFNAVGGCAIRKKSSREAQEEVVTIVYCYKIQWISIDAEA